MIDNYPIYSQRDPRWAAQHLGMPDSASDSTIGAYGCVVTCIAQKLTALVIPTLPTVIQKMLSDNRSFSGTTRNLVTWAFLPVLFPQLHYNGRFDKRPLDSRLPAAQMTMIRDRLANGDPVILYVDASRYEKGLQQHFVLAVGEFESGIDILNPWGGKRQGLRAYGPTDEQAICGAVWLDTAGDTKQGLRVITAEPHLHIRPGPGDKSRVLGDVVTGALVHVLETRDGWGRIDGPVVGWIDLAWTKPAPTI